MGKLNSLYILQVEVFDKIVRRYRNMVLYVSTIFRFDCQANLCYTVVGSKAPMAFLDNVVSVKASKLCQ
jgi:hypothetical protein